MSCRVCGLPFQNNSPYINSVDPDSGEPYKYHHLCFLAHAVQVGVVKLAKRGEPLPVVDPLGDLLLAANKLISIELDRAEAADGLAPGSSGPSTHGGMGSEGDPTAGCSTSAGEAEECTSDGEDGLEQPREGTDTAGKETQ